MTVYARNDKVVNKVVDKNGMDEAESNVLDAIRSNSGVATKGIMEQTAYSRAYIIKLIAILKKRYVVTSEIKSYQ